MIQLNRRVARPALAKMHSSCFYTKIRGTWFHWRNMVPLAEHLAEPGRWQNISRNHGSGVACLGLDVYQLARLWRTDRGKV